MRERRREDKRREETREEKRRKVLPSPTQPSQARKESKRQYVCTINSIINQCERETKEEEERWGNPDVRGRK
jgi:hypothetical protein